MQPLTLLTLAAVLLASTPVVAAQEPRPVEAMDLYRVSMVTDPQVAPDGSQVLFTRTSFDISTDLRQGELWLATLGAKGRLERRLLVGASARPAGARWSPDGTRIAYVAQVAGKPQVHVMALAEGIGRPVTTLKTAPGQLAWSPDGTRLAFVAQVEAAPVKVPGMPEKPEGATWAPPARIVTSFRYRSDSGGFLTPGARHVFLVPAAGGEVRQVTQGDLDHVVDDSQFAWTPDGRALVAAASRRPDADLRAREADLYVIPVDGGAVRQLTSAEGLETDPVVSPDGRFIAYVGTEEKPTFYARPDLWVVPVTGGAPRNLTASLDRPVQGPLWASDSRSLTFLYYDAGVARVAQLALAGEARPRVLVREAGGTRLYLPSSNTSFSAAGGTIAYPTLHADRPPGLGVVREGRVVATLDLNADWRAGKRIGRLEEVRYKSSADGRDIQGWLQYPPDFDPARKYPLVLEIHGGPNTDYSPQFSVTHQLYAAAGYLVLFTNPRGSIGYGEAFANLIDKAYPGQDHDDLMSGVDALLQRPYVDARNLFIGGGSGGGVLTTWAIGKTHRFRAAAALRPVTDWTVQALSSDLPSLTARYWLAGLPWDAHEEYWRRSPLSLVGNVKTPLILITGEADYRTPIAQTEAYFQALKLRGVDTMMVRLPEAGHSMGRPSQWLTSILMVVDWYDRHRVKDAAVAGTSSP